MVKYRINGRVVSGAELVRIASQAFTHEAHGLGRYSRPKRREQAYAFLTGEITPASRRPRVEWWSTKKQMWM